MAISAAPPHLASSLSQAFKIQCTFNRLCSRAFALDLGKRSLCFALVAYDNCTRVRADPTSIARTSFLLFQPFVTHGLWASSTRAVASRHTYIAPLTLQCGSYYKDFFSSSNGSQLGKFLFSVFLLCYPVSSFNFFE